MRTWIALLLVALAAPAYAQALTPAPPAPRQVNLSGPRFGVTALSDGVVRSLDDRHLHVDPLISQFGWQFERQFYGKRDGVSVVNEWVVLAGGLDQGLVLPSVSWLVGLRSRGGAEFGIGPNITPAGVALALACGMTFRSGIMNVPVNIAMVPSKAGMRVSILTGFSLRR